MPKNDIGASTCPVVGLSRVFLAGIVRWLLVCAFASAAFASMVGCALMTVPTQGDRASDPGEYLPLLPTEQLAEYSRMEIEEDPDRVVFEFAAQK